jgi:hypothetical protein
MTRLLPLLALVTLAGSAHLEESPPKLTLQQVATHPPEELADAIRKLLPETSEQVADANGELIAEVWFRDDIPSQATPEQVRNGLTYRELPDGVLLGAVRFPMPFIDYRKQTIPPGVYTLRFAVQPDIGDHSDTAPHPEFALLAPAAEDTSGEPLEAEALVKLSSKVTGGDHPAVMLLFPHREPPGAPKLKPQKGGAVTLALHRTVIAAEEKTQLGFALTVSGYSKLR